MQMHNLAPATCQKFNILSLRRKLLLLWSEIALKYSLDDMHFVAATTNVCRHTTMHKLEKYTVLYSHIYEYKVHLLLACKKQEATTKTFGNHTLINLKCLLAMPHYKQNSTHTVTHTRTYTHTHTRNLCAVKTDVSKYCVYAMYGRPNCKWSEA